ncbi:MAG: NAD(P)-dependent oxidoreductase [Propionibacteriaceae bacterium]|nr:NAD(P)-dependent oxidoreductase [Propionibacteriaceae bacterium]
MSGADGFIGGWLSRALLRRGDDVVALVRDGRTAPDCTEKLVCDISCYEALPHLLKDKDIAAFVHLAWDGIEGPAFLDHRRQLGSAAAAVDAVKACAEVGISHFIQVGSVNQYELLGLDHKAQAPRMANTYSAAKLAAEHMGRAFAARLRVRFNAVRLAMTYGEGNRSSMLPNVVMRQLLAGRVPKLIAGEGRYDLIHVSDAVGGLLAVLDGGRDQQTYFVGHREERTFRQIVEGIRDAIVPEGVLDFGAYPEDNHIDFDLIDTEALTRDTGYRPRADFEETVRATATWLGENP